MPHLPASSALARFRVVDMTQVRADPTCARQLADWGADVIQVQMPEHMRGDDTLSKDNPRLVYASISGFGQTGPHATRPGFDQIAQGMGGLMSVTGLPEHGPTRVGIPIANLCERSARRAAASTPRKCWPRSATIANPSFA